MAINLYEYKKELVNFLRNQDIISVSDRGVTTATETFNGNASDVDFDLSNTNVKNVRLIQISSVTQAYGTDYSIDFDGTNPGRITFTSAPASGTNNISIQYDYGSTDKVYPDFPRADLKLASYPRIGFDVISETSDNFGIGGTTDISDLNIEIVVYDIGIKALEEKGNTLRNSVRSNNKSFYNFQFIHPTTLGPLVVTANRSNEILQRNHTFQIQNVVET